MSAQIFHDEEKKKFFLVLDENAEEECYLAYREEGDVLDFYYTFVPEDYRGHGIASKLVETALEFAKKEGFRVRPTCPFVNDYIQSHEEYKALMPE